MLNRVRRAVRLALRRVAGVGASVCLLTGLSAAAVAVEVRAAEPLPAGVDVQFRRVPVPQSTVPALAQDRSGLLWVATAQGLARYDGHRLHPVLGPGRDASERNLGWVRALAPAADGGMWIGTEFRGLMRHEARTDRVRALGSAAGASGTVRNHAPIRALAEDTDGGVWIGTVGAGLQHLSPGADQPVAVPLDGLPEALQAPEPRVLALHLDRGGALWVGHWLGLARRERQGAGARWVAVSLGATPSPVQALGATRDGRVWLGTLDGRVGEVVGDAVRWVLPASDAPVQALVQDPLGRLWVGTKRGLLWLDPDTGAVLARLRQRPQRPAGLAGNDISALLRDADGALWVAGYGLGLQRHLSHPAIEVRAADLAPGEPLDDPDVRAVQLLPGGQELLAATQQGTVVRLDAREGRGLASLGLWPRERRTVVEHFALGPDGSLWLAAGNRLEHRDAQGRLRRDWPLDGGRTQQIVVRADGRVWLGQQEGLYRLDGPQADAVQRVQPGEGPALQGGVFALVDDPARDTLWIGGQSGLWRWRDERLQAVAMAPDASLASPVVMALLLGRDGTLWVDTPVAGLHRLQAWDAAGRARFVRIPQAPGQDGVFGGNLHEDAQGRIWSQLQVYDPRTERVDRITEAEGAAFGTFWFFASTALPDGRLVFGGSRGLLVVQPAAFQPPSPALRLVLTALRRNGQPLPVDPYADALTLPPATRSLGVEFAALDYADPQRPRYRYRLLGLDSAWIDTDASVRNPSFGALAPGRYTLEVSATTHPLSTPGPTLRLLIEQTPAWWQTAWAHAAAGVLGLLAIVLLVQLRTWRLRRRQAALEALVAARTAELRQLSQTDALTGLHNRHHLDEHLDDELRRTLRRFEAPDGRAPGPRSDLVLMLLDVDRFKRINDRHGHAAGDAVLVELTRRLRQVFRDSDLLVRWGGEEILVLVRDTDRDAAAELAARAVATVREAPFDLGEGRHLPVTASIGFAAFPLDPAHPRAWDWASCLQLADAALYAAKSQGRDGYVGALNAEGLTPAPAQGDFVGLLGHPRLRTVSSHRA